MTNALWYFYKRGRGNAPPLVANARAFKSERALGPNKKCAADIKVWADDYEQNSHTCEKCPIVFTTFLFSSAICMRPSRPSRPRSRRPSAVAARKGGRAVIRKNSTSGEATESANFVSEYNNIIINISDRFDETVTSKTGLSK